MPWLCTNCISPCRNILWLNTSLGEGSKCSDFPHIPVKRYILQDMACLLGSVSLLCILVTGLELSWVEWTSFAILKYSNLLSRSDHKKLCSLQIDLNKLHNLHHASVFLFSDLKGLINLAVSRQTAWFKKITQNSKPQNVILILRKATILRLVTFQIIRFFDVTLLTCYFQIIQCQLEIGELQSSHPHPHILTLRPARFESTAKSEKCQLQQKVCPQPAQHNMF